MKFNFRVMKTIEIRNIYRLYDPFFIEPLKMDFPMKMYFDIGKGYKKHNYGLVVFFQTDKEKETNDLKIAMMTVSDNPVVYGNVKHFPKKDIEFLKQWVIKHKQDIKHLANYKLSTREMINIIKDENTESKTE